ncbi:MAG: hypothetical protein AB1551_08330 [Actinomycetota bacterium]
MNVHHPGERAPWLIDVTRELDRQREAYGDRSALPDGTGQDTFREMAEQAGQVRRSKAEQGSLAWRHILSEGVFTAFAESDPAKLRGYLVEVAAAAVAWMEALDCR